MLTLYCGKCGEKHFAEEWHAGHKIKCSKCGCIIPIPLPKPSPAVPEPRPAPSYPVRSANPVPPPTNISARANYTVPLIGVGMIVVLAVFLALSRQKQLGRPPQEGSAGTQVTAPSATPDGGSSGEIQRPTIQQPPPPELERPAFALPNGAEIKPPADPMGRGVLIIQNGNERDAVAKLIDSSSHQLCRWVYVRAGHETTLRDIGPSTYLLRFALGIDWDRHARRFLRDKSYTRFLNPLEFTETSTTQDGSIETEFTEHRVTLHPTPEGRAKTESIDERAFEANE